VIKLVSDLRQVSGFLRVLRFPPPIKLTATIQLKINIVESGVRHHHTNIVLFRHLKYFAEIVVDFVNKRAESKTSGQRLNVINRVSVFSINLQYH
jgi:hypothetical protein